ncbi:NF-kappa-B inhibitor-interacting Ras-like protein 1 isoform X1 [Lontra canadensis]|uniref:NF-kappa-B inhibitor-interacting Ras-like protein 1 isoform X1 n=2 Tax=Lontra canadensis TaxID=76717 RepID=UPI0013F2F3D9|nr:NF-kappa-B inhibitor-interacting Ras-like protein 1 isoform X1 [Lontra canadensis]
MGKGCKVVVCGLLSVGKTAILEQLLYGNHTIGMEDCETMEDVYMASVETDRGVKEQLHLYDTRGLQEGVELPKHYFSFADGFVLVYSVNNLESFQRVELLKKEIDKFKDKKEVAIVVLGNKIDLSEQRQVDAEVAQQWARSEKVRLWEDLQLRTTRKSQGQKVRRTTYCTWRVTGFLLGPRRPGEKGKGCLHLQRAESVNKGGYALWVKYRAAFGGESLFWPLVHC